MGKRRESRKFCSDDMGFVVSSFLSETAAPSSCVSFPSLKPAKEELRVAVCDWRGPVEGKDSFDCGGCTDCGCAAPVKKSASNKEKKFLVESAELSAPDTALSCGGMGERLGAMVITADREEQSRRRRMQVYHAREMLTWKIQEQEGTRRDFFCFIIFIIT